jgi:hypothetical protein
MPRRVFIVPLSTLVFLGAAATAPAATTPDRAPRIVGAIVSYAYTAGGSEEPKGRTLTIDSVVRFAGPFSTHSETVVLGRKLQTGHTVGALTGGGFISRVGAASRHCYEVDTLRVSGTPALHYGARWTLGILGDKRTILATRTVALHHPDPAKAARTLGCDA